MRSIREPSNPPHQATGRQVGRPHPQVIRVPCSALPRRLGARAGPRARVDDSGFGGRDHKRPTYAVRGPHGEPESSQTAALAATRRAGPYRSRRGVAQKGPIQAWRFSHRVESPTWGPTRAAVAGYTRTAGAFHQRSQQRGESATEGRYVRPRAAHDTMVDLARCLLVRPPKPGRAVCLHT